MKNYLYQGDQSSLSMNTRAGALLLKKGVLVEVALVLHNAIKDHPVIKSLVSSGELVVTDAPTETVEQSSSDQTDYSKMTVAELKELLTAENIFFDSDAKKADLVALLTSAGS